MCGAAAAGAWLVEKKTHAAVMDQSKNPKTASKYVKYLLGELNVNKAEPASAYMRNADPHTYSFAN